MSAISSAAVEHAVAEPGLITLSEWDEVYSHLDDAYELVKGVPTMSPNESMVNLVIATELSAIIRSATGRAYVAPTQVSVTLVATDPPTVRRPDLLVCRRERVRDVARIDAAMVELVVEVVSRGSIERDRVAKKGEYAQAGIPAYLLVDRFAGRLVLFTDPCDGAYRRVTSADDPDRLSISLGKHSFAVSLGNLS